ncbi:hypothetical protein P171DRAFT_447832 [Karstenula rhodostoma CBS 690.94]|uniref:Uncharacterized protein n=1 Tax=Karstenula rhodostoma CBS 690.94 TaxID=1392251 RepID=A0A9P4U684_9PLEO|nr:hypothetical protein P171DRAFT_447832 [Karstenula rhodostoma CBS 690.94]
MKRMLRAAQRRGPPQSCGLQVALTQPIPRPGPPRAAVTKVHVTVRNPWIHHPSGQRTPCGPWHGRPGFPCHGRDEVDERGMSARLHQRRPLDLKLAPYAITRPARAREPEAVHWPQYPYRLWAEFHHPSSIIHGVSCLWLGRHVGRWSTWLFLASFTDPHAQAHIPAASREPRAASRQPPAVTVTRTHRLRKRMCTLCSRNVEFASSVPRAVRRPICRRRSRQSTAVAREAGYVQQPQPTILPILQKQNDRPTARDHLGNGCLSVEMVVACIRNRRVGVGRRRKSIYSTNN